MNEKEELRISVRCPVCKQRVFDKVSTTSGFIEMKCPTCKHVIKVNLSLRRIGLKYRIVAKAV